MGAINYLELSELDQLMPRVYVRWILCFPLTSESPSKTQILDLIRSGVVKTFQDLPILQGNLVPKSSDEDSRMRIVFPMSHKTDFELQVQHHDDVTDNTLPTYESLLKANFPVVDLPHEILTPPDLPSTPVFDIMPTFIRGGLLLCIKCSHVAVDGAGMGIVTQLLARNCFAKADPTADRKVLPVPSFDRSRLRTTKSGPSGLDIGFQLLDKEFAEKANIIGKDGKEYAPMTSHIFKFSATALKKLKSLCETSTERITTHDALTALVYGTVCYARCLRLTQSSTTESTLPSTIGIAVNCRNRVDPPMLDYAGNLTVYATFSNPLSLPVFEIPSSLMSDTQQLAISLHLAKLASQTRGAITTVTSDPETFINSTIHLSSTAPNVSLVQPTFMNLFQGTDFFISSWAGFPVFDDEWWPGGFAEALRIPLKMQWDGTCGVLATKDRTAGLDILLGMREDDMKVVEEILLAFGAHVA